MLRFSLCYLTALLQVLFLPLAALGAYPYLCAVGVVLALLSWRKRIRALGTTALFLFCATFTQWQIAHFWAQANAASQLGAISTTAAIVEVKSQSAVYTSVVAKLDLRPWQLGWQKLLLNWKLDSPAQVGARWQLSLKPTALKGRLNIGGFSRQRWLIAQGIIATATVNQGQKLAEPSGLRAELLAKTQRALTNLENKGLLLALGFGEREAVSQSQWALFRASGTAHLMAISGLHIGLIALFGFMLARAMQWLMPARWVSPHFPLLTSFVFALLYSYLANFSLPTQRALCMLGVWLLATMLRIHLRPWQVLLYAALVVTLIWPFAYLQSGFWLSFGAVAAIGLFNTFLPLGQSHWRGQNLKVRLQRTTAGKLAYAALGLLHLQVGLLLLLTPLQLWLFGQLPLGALWSNLLLLPIFTVVVMPLLLFNIATAALPWAWLDSLLSGCLWLLESLPNRLLSLSNHQMLALSAVLFGLTALLLLILKWRPVNHDDTFAKPFLHYGKSALAFGVLALGCLGGMVARAPQWQLNVMDVGQGLSLVLNRHHNALIYDTGVGWGGGSMAKLEIMPFLTHAGLEPQWLVVSHDDNDHSGGARDLLTTYPNLHLISPSHKDYGRTPMACVQGQRWQWQGFEITALWPPRQVVRAQNGDSCVLLIARDGLRFLLTGDLNAAGERAIAAQVGPVDWLQVAHHGSKTSSSWRFLSQLQPRVALIGVGLNNPWRFPHPSVLTRLEKVQSAVFDTARCGQIQLSVYDPPNVEITCARSRYAPWFHSIVGVAGNNS
ncbi:DNA internalization-related competence protein ComEC/Rec2 [Pasteurellaceae bacterium TAE3-ERU1]|nr:DNA internalization-related competence protein ComEC/Rec2 [Pasteurellaceae bacterium TAE3-ERU1]